MSTAPAPIAAPWAAPQPAQRPPSRNRPGSRWSERSRRRWAVIGLSALSLACGPLLMALVYLILGATGELVGEEAVYGPGRPVGLLITADLLLGVASVGLLPVVLRHGPAHREVPLEEGGGAEVLVSRQEPRSALVAGLALCVFTMVSSSAWMAWCIAVISLCSRGRLLWTGLIYGTSVVVGVLGYWATNGFGHMTGVTYWGDVLMTIAILAITFMVPVLIGMYRWSRRRRIRALQAEALTARREAAALVGQEQARAEQSRAQERTRIAREMHDTLSHRLALISMYAGALDYREDLDRDTVRSTAQLVQQTAATASAELRTVLDVLRDDPGDTRPQPDLREVPQLLQEFRGAGVRIEVIGDELIAADELPDTTARTLYRILQEALANAVKHAPGAPVTIRWDRGPESVGLTVSNPLVQGAHPVRSGFGLVGLDERARGLGGTLTTQRTETTFRLEACIPCRS